MIRLTVPSIEEDDYEAVRKVLATGYLVQGAKVGTFEQVVADYVGTRHAVAVSNCTAALHLALLALNVGPGDLVVVTAYSFVATANVIELCGAQPIFVDIEEETFNLDPNQLEQTLQALMASTNSAKRVKAILPVHTFGQMADMPAILEIAERYGLPVVEDAACALGATLCDRQAGKCGIMGCFSFHPRKAITTGEGGIVTTDDPGLVRRLKALRNHGMDPDATALDFVMPGFNYRMTEVQAALGITQMAKFDRVVAARRRLASHYDELLKRTPFRPPVLLAGSKPVYQSYVALLPEKTARNRSEVIALLRKQGIEATIGTWHIPLTTYYRTCYGYAEGDFPVSDQIFLRAITLPLYEGLAETDQDRVVATLESTL